MTGNILFLLLLLALSAFFSASETAFTSLSAIQVKELEKSRPKRGRVVKKLAERPEILISTLLIGNNLVNIGASAITTEAVISLFGSKALGISSGILTLVILIFSEVTPKRVAILYNDFIAANTAHVVLVLSFVLRPVVWFVTLFSSLVTKLISRKPASRISLDGIIHVVNMAREAGILKDYQDSMVKSVFRFNETPVEAIMTHRTEVFSLDANKVISAVLQLVNQEGYSRIPVYDGHPEKIVGIVLAKDIMDRVINGKADLRLKDIMIKPLFVSETRKVNELFWQFKKARLNLAVVMDEYGGLAGIVTQEDVVEELFGELYDEDEEKGWEKITALPEGCYRVMGDTSLAIVRDLLGIELPHGKYVQTIAGYIIDRLDRFPVDRETIEIPEGKLVVESVYRNKVRSVRFIPKKPREQRKT